MNPTFVGPQEDLLFFQRLLRAFLLGTVCCLLLTFVACSDSVEESAGPPGAPADLSGLRAELITPGGVLLVAGRGAEPASVGQVRFGNLGAFELFVASRLDGSFYVRFRVGKRNLGQPFNFSLAGKTESLGRVPDAEGWLQFGLPGVLEAGVHRIYLALPEGLSLQVVEALVVREAEGGDEVMDAFDDFAIRSQISSFFLTHLAGEQPSRPGTLLYGDVEHRVPLDVDDRGELTTVVLNLGREAVSVRLDLGSGEEVVELAAGASERVSASVDRGPVAVSIAVESQAESRGLVLLGSPAFEPQRPLGKTPVVLITLDTTRRDAVAPFLDGEREGLTPNLAAFAREATVFRSAFSVAPWTLPSHSSMLTGLYPFEHGAGLRSLELELGFDSAAEILRDVGYRTAGVAGGFLCHHKWGVGQGFDEYYDPDGFESTGDSVSEKAIAFLESVGQRPFFLFANYFDPHGLYLAPEEFRRRVGAFDLLDEVPEDRQHFRRLAAGEQEAWRMLLAGEAHGNEVEHAYLRAEYDAEVAFMDQQIGRLLDRLKALDLYSQSLIVMLADHGEMLGEKGFYGHGARLDQEQIAIPFLVKWPGQESGYEVEEPVSSIDVFPTLLAAAGVHERGQIGDARELTQQGFAAPADRPFVLQEEHNGVAHPLFGPMVLAPDVLGVQSRDQQFWSWDGGRLCQEMESPSGSWIERPCESMTWPEAEFSRFEGAVPTLALGTEAKVSDTEREALEALGYINND